MNEVAKHTYHLHERQGTVFHDPARFIVLVAGRRWGKTRLAIFKIIRASLEKQEARIWYIAPLYRQAKDIAWKLLKKFMLKQYIAKINETELTITLKNGSEIALKGADNPDSLLGVGLDFVVLDEYASMKPDVWQEVVRPMLSDTMGKALFIGTPKGKNHFWQLFTQGQRNELGYKSYHFTTADNPYIPETELDIAKEQLDDRFFKQEYMASFEDFTGLVYPEFARKRHVISDVPVTDKMTAICAIDPALTGVFGWLLAYVDKDDCFYITKEYYEKDKRVSEIAVSLPKDVTYIIDPNFGYSRILQREGHLYSFADEFLDLGINVRKGEEEVEAGISRVREYLHNGRIKIHSSCKNLISEIERYHYQKDRETVRGASSPKPYKKDDHLMDCLRYIIMSRARSHQAEEHKKAPKMSVAYEMEKKELEEMDFRTKWRTHAKN